MKEQEFDPKALCAPIVFYRTYSRKDNERENWHETINRASKGLSELGKLSLEESELIEKYYKSSISLPSGRWLWVGGTEWVKHPQNYLGAYNCASLNTDEPYVFGHLMYMAMQGCGTGAVLEQKYIDNLPIVKNRLKLNRVSEVGKKLPEDRVEQTVVSQTGRYVTIRVGDSKEGWRDGYQALLDLAFDKNNPEEVYEVEVDLTSVRAEGEKLKGFGGISNPVGLPELFHRVSKILNCANGRKLNAEECCLIVDEAAKAVVAGNLRRSAGMKQFDSDAPLLKQNLWQPDENGIWKIDPERDALRMSNHTRNFHYKPSLKEVKEAVATQFYSGEGAILWAGEAIARSNADLLYSTELKEEFLNKYNLQKDVAKDFLEKLYFSIYKENISKRELEHRMARYATNPCARGDMKLLTSEGYKRIDSLVDSEPNIVNKDGVRVKSFVWCSGEKPVYRITLSTEQELYFTSDHVFATLEGEYEVQNLEGKHLKQFLDFQQSPTVVSVEYEGIDKVYDFSEPITHWGVIENFIVHNCGEIEGTDFLCNLSEVHLNKVDPFNEQEQYEAFKVAGLSVVSLLQHKFVDERQQYSRELDPIVGAGATGIFDFFVNLLGEEWLDWWIQGRTRSHSKAKEFLEIEANYLSKWKNIVRETVEEYCKKHNLKTPNRYTCIKPSGSQSLLSNASPGWHPPKGAYFIRRITVAKEDPVGLAAIECGYSVIPSQGDKDEEGNLLNDPFDSRVNNWLIEVPMKTSWAEIPHAENYDPAKFSAAAQFDFMMQVQKYYTSHNSSSTIELREHEIDELSELIYNSIQNNEGYISAALLARFDAYQTFPRLPFEPISKEVYEQRAKDIKPDKFYDALYHFDVGKDFTEAGPSGCDSDKCLMEF